MPTDAEKLLLPETRVSLHLHAAMAGTRGCALRTRTPLVVRAGAAHRMRRAGPRLRSRHAEKGGGAGGGSGALRRRRAPHAQVPGAEAHFAAIFGACEDSYRAHRALAETAAAKLAGEGHATSAPELFYGEASLEAVARVLDAAHAREGDTFLDLGSGSGKAVIAAALVRPDLASVRGIEILPELHTEALAAQQRMPPDRAWPRVLFECGNLLEADLRAADVVYFFSTCFPRALCDEVELAVAAQMKAGGRFVCVSKQLANFSGRFEEVGQVALPQPHVGGGSLTAFVYRAKG